MYLSETNSRTKSHLNISNVEPRFGATKLAAGAPHIRAFCECAGVCAIRCILILAVISAALLIAARPAQAQTETALYNFCSQPNCSDGAGPQSSLTFDSAGNLYGTTSGGGAFGAGTVFELSPNGSGGWNEAVLYSFTGGTDGGWPYYSGVIFDSAGNLYGTAEIGGANGYGVVFELSPVGTSWTETVLYSFDFSGGAYPLSGLIMDPAGNLYGTASSNGGAFELSPSGGGWTEQVIYGAENMQAGLTMDAAGNIFGINQQTIFEVSPNGNGGWHSAVIYTFADASKDGSYPVGTLVLDDAGSLYGTTEYGGKTGSGTVYKLTPVTTGKKKGTWTERILHTFNGKNGSGPRAGLVFDAAGNIYGTTANGGRYGDGIGFELAAVVGKSSYKPTVLWTFGYDRGAGPFGSLILDSAGNLYGTTYAGGDYGAGVVFEVTP